MSEFEEVNISLFHFLFLHNSYVNFKRTPPISSRLSDISLQKGIQFSISNFIRGNETWDRTHSCFTFNPNIIIDNDIRNIFDTNDI